MTDVLSELPPTFLQSFVAALFSTPERAVAATKLIGAPLALACRDALASEAGAA